MCAQLRSVTAMSRKRRTSLVKSRQHPSRARRADLSRSRLRSRLPRPPGDDSPVRDRFRRGAGAGRADLVRAGRCRKRRPDGAGNRAGGKASDAGGARRSRDVRAGSGRPAGVDRSRHRSPPSDRARRCRQGCAGWRRSSSGVCCASAGATARPGRLRNNRGARGPAHVHRGDENSRRKNRNPARDGARGCGGHSARKAAKGTKNGAQEALNDR